MSQRVHDERIMAGNERGRVLRLVTGGYGHEETDPLLPIARAARSGDTAAIRTFLVSVSPHLLRVVRRVLGSQHPDVDDVVQESAFALMDALPRYREESSVLHFV